MNRLKAAVLVLLAVTLTWKVQVWRYGEQLALQAQAHAHEGQQLAEASASQQLGERRQRLALEQQIEASDQSHYQELLDAQQAQARLRDRLATADLRLSALLGADPAPGLSAASGASGLDHDRLRARLDPAHARRTIAVTDQGDRGLIALRGCQAYIRALQR